MVSVFPGRFVTEPQKAPALTRSQMVKAVTGEERGRTRRAEEGGRGGRGGAIKKPAQDNNSLSTSSSNTPHPRQLSLTENLCYKLDVGSERGVNV